MKKLFFTLFTLFFFVALHAQLYYNESGADMAKYQHFIDSAANKRVADHIIGYRTYTYKPDSTVISGYLSNEIKFDKNGNISEYTTFNKRGKIVDKFIEKWSDKNQYISYTSLKRNGRFNYSMAYTYNTSGDEIERKYCWKKPENMTNHGFMTYDEKHNMLECKYLIKKDRKNGYRYVYSYYPDGSKKQTVEYDNHGKIQHTWNYDCSSVGKLVVNKLKDTSKLCIHYEKDASGNELKIKEEFAKNGPVVRTIIKTDSYDNQVEEIRYNKHGKILYHVINIFNNKSKITEQKQYTRDDKKLKTRKVFYYNSDGRLDQMIEYKSDSKPIQIVKYELVKG